MLGLRTVANFLLNPPLFGSTSGSSPSPEDISLSASSGGPMSSSSDSSSANKVNLNSLVPINHLDGANKSRFVVGAGMREGGASVGKIKNVALILEREAGSHFFAQTDGKTVDKSVEKIEADGAFVIVYDDQGRAHTSSLTADKYQKVKQQAGLDKNQQVTGFFAGIGETVLDEGMLPRLAFYDEAGHAVEAKSDEGSLRVLNVDSGVCIDEISPLKHCQDSSNDLEINLANRKKITTELHKRKNNPFSYTHNKDEVTVDLTLSDSHKIHLDHTHGLLEWLSHSDESRKDHNVYSDQFKSLFKHESEHNSFVKDFDEKMKKFKSDIFTSDHNQLNKNIEVYLNNFFTDIENKLVVPQPKDAEFEAVNKNKTLFREYCYKRIMVEAILAAKIAEADTVTPGRGGVSTTA